METNATAPNCAFAETPSASTTRGALAGLSLAMLLSSLGTSIASVALPSLAQAFGATFQSVQWIVLVYLLTLTAVIVSVGKLGDRFGRRRVLLTGIFLFTAASVVASSAPTLGVLIAARALQGLGAAGMMTLTMAFVGEIMPKTQTGRAMGLLATMSAVGTALGPSLGGLLIAAFGWRALFLLNVSLGLAALFLSLRYLPADRPCATGAQDRFDLVGTLLLASALSAYALAMTLGRGHFTAFNALLLVTALAAAGLFVRIESRLPAPLVRVALLEDRALRAGLISNALVSTVMMTTLVVGPFYLSLVLGLKSAAVGLVLTVGPLVTALTGVPAGRLADHYGASRVASLGLAGIAGGASLLALLPIRFGLAGFVAPIVIITAAYALFQTANNTAVMRRGSADQRGVVSGLLNLSRNLGLITGASMMGAVFSFAAKTADVVTANPAAVAFGMRVTFAVAVTLIVIAIAFTPRDRTRVPDTQLS